MMMPVLDGTPFWVLCLLCAAPFVGSFLGTLVLRLPEGRSIVVPASHCEGCSRRLSPIDLIPIASWMLLLGRCRNCKTPLSPIYPLVECTAIVIVLWAATVVPPRLLLATAFLGWMLFTIAAIDWRTQTIPDALSLALAIGGVTTTYVIAPSALWSHMLAGIGGYLAFTALNWLYRMARYRDGLGRGDAKLIAAIGTWVSWPGLPTAILYASLLALLSALIRAASGRHVSLTDKFPLGTYLAAAAWLVWLYGPLVGT